jgi:DNA-binding IclR family transcriptional regulator
LANWGFLTNHAHILTWVTQHPHSTVREIALATALTERATLAILQDLKREGIIVAERVGRRNTYSIDFDALRRFPYWGPAETPLPDSLIQAAIRALTRVAGKSTQASDKALTERT